MFRHAYTCSYTSSYCAQASLVILNCYNSSQRLFEFEIRQHDWLKEKCCSAIGLRKCSILIGRQSSTQQTNATPRHNLLYEPLEISMPRYMTCNINSRKLRKAITYEPLEISEFRFHRLPMYLICYTVHCIMQHFNLQGLVWPSVLHCVLHHFNIGFVIPERFTLCSASRLKLI
jgi:hypothetical protein